MIAKLAEGWESIVTAPSCRAATKGDSGRRPILVTHFPFNGSHAPVAIAQLTAAGWKVGGGGGGRKLWFEPTHWRGIPEVNQTAASAKGSPPRAVLETRPEGEGAGRANSHAASRRVVRLHPLPENSNLDLADVLGKVIAGAVRSALQAHGLHLARHLRGMLVGSIRKRAVNQLVCSEGETMLRAALGKEGTEHAP